MVKSSKGFHSRTRGTLTKEVRERGMPPVTKFLQTFAPGSRVIVRLEASDTRGMPHPRYQGRVAVVIGRVGRAFRIEFLDGNKRKQLIANAVHLIPAGPASESHA
jgi:large subunit ribosomal protein L21e